MSDIKLGFVDRTVLVFIPDPASTDGSGKTGLVAANLTVSYTRVETDNDVIVTDATSSLNDLANLLAAHNDWGIKEVSSTLAPGLYRLDVADAVFATGAWESVVYVMITTSAAAASPIKFTLVAFDPLDGVRHGLTALPNAAADAAGGLAISDAGGLDLDARLDAAVSSRMATYAQPTGFLAASFPTDPADHSIIAGLIAGVDAKVDTIDDFLDTEIAAIKTQTDKMVFTVANQLDVNVIDWKGSAAPAMTGDAYARLGAPAGASIAADIAAGKTVVDAIKLKTDNLPSDPADESLIIDATNAIMSRLGAPAGASVSADIAGNLTAIGALHNLSAAAVNAEVVDALNVDTYAEPSGTPPATNTIVGKLGWLAMALRNRIDVDSGFKYFYDDAGNVEWKKALSDNGTTYSEGEAQAA